MSTLSSLRSYSRERVTFPSFDVLAVVLVLVSRLDVRATVHWPALLDICLAFLVLWQLRLWNDLVRLDENRLRYPNRLLARTRDLAPYHLAVIGLFVVVFLALTARGVFSLGPRLAPIVYTALMLFLASCYESRRRRRTAPVLYYHAVLLEFPVLVYLVSPGGSVPWRAMAFTYLVVCIYEVFRDRRLHRLLEARVAAGLEIATLVVGALITALGLPL